MALLKRIKRIFKNQSGFGLAETLVAVALLGTAVVVFVVALSTGSLSVSEQEQETIAQRLAQNQIEFTKNAAFSVGGAYTLVAAPSGYTISLNTSSVAGADTNIQKITVTVLHSGTSILAVSGYKVNR